MFLCVCLCVHVSEYKYLCRTSVCICLVYVCVCPCLHVYMYLCLISVYVWHVCIPALIELIIPYINIWLLLGPHLSNSWDRDSKLSPRKITARLEVDLRAAQSRRKACVKHHAFHWSPLKANSPWDSQEKRSWSLGISYPGVSQAPWVYNVVISSHCCHEGFGGPKCLFYTHRHMKGNKDK